MATRTKTAKRERVYRGGASPEPKRSRAERNGQFLTKADVADELAITERMVERLIAEGKLKRAKVNNLVRIHRDDLAAYIAQLRVDQ